MTTKENLNEPLLEPIAEPVVGYKVPVEPTPIEPKMVTVRAIDWLRPDHAVLRGMMQPKIPQPYEERYAHQGKREVARRLKKRKNRRLKRMKKNALEN